MTQLIINLPFAGFYGSNYSEAIDYEEERECEYMEEKQSEDGIPEDQHLTASEFSEAFYDAATYSDAYKAVAVDYVQAFQDYFNEKSGLGITLTFESMTSPREYNFETDRVFAYISQVDLEAIRSALLPGSFENTVAERFTSRSGFISFYSTDVDEWNSKPIEEWDHNELSTILHAYIAQEFSEDLDHEVFYRMADGECFSEAFSNCVDWAKFDAKVAEMRADKLEESK
jgi:hypothetical protein